MRRRIAEFIGLVAFAACLSTGQTTGIPSTLSHYVEIKLPADVPSEHFFGRYVLDPGANTDSDLGEWIRPVKGVNSYVIDTSRSGRASRGLKAILYAPGCVLQTLDLALSAANNPHYEFVCQPAPSVQITGSMIRSDRLYGRDVNVQAKYVARWGAKFLGLDESTLITIPIGEPQRISADGRFTVTVPDLSKDPVAGNPDHPGELQFWVAGAVDHNVVAQLVPTKGSGLTTPFGGMTIQNGLPAEITFAPCGTSVIAQDPETGFTLRPGRYDVCDR